MIEDDLFLGLKGVVYLLGLKMMADVCLLLCLDSSSLVWWNND